MDTRLLISRVKNIIAQPSDEWKEIAKDTNDSNFHIKSFALPFIVALSVAKLINAALIQKGFQLLNAFVFSLIDFSAYFLGMYLTALLISYISPSFLADNDKTKSFKFIIYASTPVYLATVVTNIFDSLMFLKLFYLYSIYLFWLGVEIVLKTPEKNKLVFVILITVLFFGIEEAIRGILFAIFPVNVPTVG